MNKIKPHLWFDTQAVEAARFYSSIFDDSKVDSVTTLHDTPSGDCDVVSFEIAGQPFMAISAGPLFKFTPAVSFLVACKTKQEVDALWGRLSENGKALMPLDSYPFSDRYGWTEDRYGLSWQIMHAEDQDIEQKITPVLMFSGDVCGKAEETLNYYASVFPNSQIGDIFRYGRNEDPDREGTIKHASFVLDGQRFAAMDSARVHDAGFNKAISLMVTCDTQQEIDRYWDALTAIPEAEQCGWLKDKFGLSWQVVPSAMDEMLSSGTKDQIERVTNAFLEMTKFDLAELRRAYEGQSTAAGGDR